MTIMPPSNQLIASEILDCNSDYAKDSSTEQSRVTMKSTNAPSLSASPVFISKEEPSDNGDEESGSDSVEALTSLMFRDNSNTNNNNNNNNNSSTMRIEGGQEKEEGTGSSTVIALSVTCDDPTTEVDHCQGHMTPEIYGLLNTFDTSSSNFFSCNLEDENDEEEDTSENDFDDDGTWSYASFSSMSMNDSSRNVIRGGGGGGIRSLADSNNSFSLIFEEDEEDGERTEQDDSSFISAVQVGTNTNQDLGPISDGNTSNEQLEVTLCSSHDLSCERIDAGISFQIKDLEAPCNDDSNFQLVDTTSGSKIDNCLLQADIDKSCSTIMEKKRVRFQFVHIREYEVTVGCAHSTNGSTYNNGVAVECPLELSWEHSQDDITIDIGQATHNYHSDGGRSSSSLLGKHGVLPHGSISTRRTDDSSLQQEKQIPIQRLSVQERREYIARYRGITMEEVIQLEREACSLS